MCCSLLAAAHPLLTRAALQVSLLTCAPGPDIYEREGHTGLRFYDPETGTDFVANWGLFDFASPGFVYRFVKGETDYMVGAIPTRLFLDSYRGQQRRVTEQIINMTPEQAAHALELVEVNLLPENRVYRYNYVKDNCSTRPLAIIERSIGAISFPSSPVWVGHESTTYRHVMEHYHLGYPWYQFGIDLALGSGIDTQISTRDITFAPIATVEMVRSATVDTPAGRIPLITSENVLVDGASEGVSQPHTQWWLTPFFIFLISALAISMVSIYDWITKKRSRWLSVVLYLLYGVAGCIIAFLVFVSVHEATSPNWLILWLNPLCLLVAILSIPRRAPRALLWLQIARLAGIAVLIGVWLGGVQSCNSAFIFLVIADLTRIATDCLNSK